MILKIWLFPVAVTILLPMTIIVTYMMAVFQNHVDPVFPFISDTGTIPPESCIFAQMLNLSAIIAAFCMYLRHRQIVEFHRKSKHDNRKLLRTSNIFLLIGYVCMFGLSMVGNFQETNLFEAHILGAMLAFGLGLVYIWGQTVIGSRMKKPLDKARWMGPIRLTLCILCTVFFIATAVSSCLLGTEGNPPYRLKPGHPKYYTNLTSTTCEWFMAACFIVYFTTFAFELRHAVLIAPKLILNYSEVADVDESSKKAQNSSTSVKDKPTKLLPAANGEDWGG